MGALTSDERFTYADYYSWDDGERWELIDGVPYSMSPAPTPPHQSISGNLHTQLNVFLKGKPCKVFIAPFDVRLFGLGDKERTVLQPDITVVCDRSKLDKKGLNGTPDMVVEVLSPSSSRHDTLTKFNLYKRAGVREYWLINPGNNTLTVYLLEGDKYNINVYGEEDKVAVNVLTGCVVDLADVFGDVYEFLNYEE